MVQKKSACESSTIFVISKMKNVLLFVLLCDNTVNQVLSLFANELHFFGSTISFDQWILLINQQFVLNSRNTSILSAEGDDGKFIREISPILHYSRQINRTVHWGMGRW